MELDYTPLEMNEIIDGEKIAHCLFKETESERDRWEGALVGFILGPKPSYAAMKKFVTSRWKHVGTMEVYNLDRADVVNIILLDPFDSYRMDANLYNRFQSEEILNPAVPMALRLSGILMGGVVIVYERKVKILYDDVQRLLVEINEAWKVKSVSDRNVLPKGKCQAKYEAVTLPDHHEEMELGVGDPSDYRHFSMRLDEVDIPDISNCAEGDDLSKHNHQADAINITLLDPFDSYRMDANLYNHFQRFDIEEDECTQLNSSPQEHSPVPMTLVSSPLPQEEPQPATCVQEQHPEPHGTEDALQPQQNEQKRGPTKRKPRKEPKCFVMDYEQTIIPGHTYQSWLENPSDIISTRKSNAVDLKVIMLSQHVNLRSTMKTTHLMDLPPVALCGLLGQRNKEAHYPPPLMELWLRCTQLRTTNASDSVLPAGRTSATQLPEQFLPSSRTHDDQIPMEFPLEKDLPSGDGFEPFEVPMENPGGNLNNSKMPWDVSAEKLMPNHINNEFPWKVSSTGTPGINLVDFEMPVNEANLFVTPGNSGNNAGTIPSSGSGNDFQIHIQELKLHSGRSSRKRPYSSSHGHSNLESVAEEPSAPFDEQGFKLPGVYENGPTPDHELLVETGPTPSQHRIVNHPVDKITDSMRKYLKTHFDMPGVPQVESLNHLAFEMERRKAAQLFYQTCVLATRDFLRVEQTIPYGDILISRGSKM
ncbi:sister chromatid cohesion 1 protein 1-like [Telopea speciosissima]|uniref:sister chromatid cohesion 1 protein 1-like n=1 Tax=Telopea speciosissima TaxID=54955 RepID=UPI001CC46A1C|nr:sister chromatid cohesion 1 protein 1-like [Telopea speciosissima]